MATSESQAVMAFIGMIGAFAVYSLVYTLLYQYVTVDFYNMLVTWNPDLAYFLQQSFIYSIAFFAISVILSGYKSVIRRGY